MILQRKWWAAYLANRRSKEIHRIGGLQQPCSIELMNRENAIYCTGLWAWFLIKFRKYNGCRYCWPEQDRG